MDAKLLIENEKDLKTKLEEREKELQKKCEEVKINLLFLL